MNKSQLTKDKLTKDQVKVVYLPNQYDQKSLAAGCREILELVIMGTVNKQAKEARI